MNIVDTDPREFELYALALPHGPNFEEFALYSTWRSENAGSVGAVLFNGQQFRLLVLRRQTDHRFVVTHDDILRDRSIDPEAHLKELMRPEEPPEAMPPSQKRRPRLFTVGSRKLNERFRLITSAVSHYPALMTIGETYLAMPRPDDNSVPDFQTDNFDSRLWELYLFACFREQGIRTSQDQPSPDFFIERDGHSGYVEAVTTNPPGERLEGFPPPQHSPEDHTERMIGPAAERFAKTLRNKLQREYHNMPHVRGHVFAIAIADFHAPSSMIWSREALPSYLYGIHAYVEEGPEGRVAVGERIENLRGDAAIPAGLFGDQSMADLSAVIFSNAGTIAKFNRMGVLAGFRPPRLRFVRAGTFFDRTPGALEPIPFELDILSDEYAAKWPPHGEPWCQELEVFHNPLAAHPMPFDLLPGATHWFERDGEIVCETIWEWSVLASVTKILTKDRDETPTPPLDHSSEA
ncbi:hypothetical protein [Lentisalinibacter salinarum]|uniref:hypothetical protein n=1 Tax=Lentisalinibacter salinarum TaxID=2992239 RepID=UPI003864BB87